MAPLLHALAARGAFRQRQAAADRQARGWLQGGLPYFLTVASSSFVYVALADLIPQLQIRLTARQTAAQIVWLLVGMGVVMLMSRAAHVH